MDNGRSLLVKIDALAQATANGKMTWTNDPDYLCLNGRYKGQEYVICKYENDFENREEISFDTTNKYGLIEGDITVYIPNSPEFERLNALYTQAHDMAKIVEY